jgi:hypothetical protein
VLLNSLLHRFFANLMQLNLREFQEFSDKSAAKEAECYLVSGHFGLLTVERNFVARSGTLRCLEHLSNLA